MSSQNQTLELAPPSTPVLSNLKAKRLLSSSPVSIMDLFGASKRTKVEAVELHSSPRTESDIFGVMEYEQCTLSAIDEGDVDTPGRNGEIIEISSDPVLPSADEPGSEWDMHTATSESACSWGNKVVNIAPEIKHFLLQRGPDQRIGEDNYPSVVYINSRTGKMYQCIVDRELFFRRRDLSGGDDTALWLQTNIYIGDLMDRCMNETDNKDEKFPILHRNGYHLIITSDPLTTAEDVPIRLKDAVKSEWNRLISRYGDLNDIQNEQKALVDRAFCLLSQYQTAIASRDLLIAMRINNLLDELRAALNDLFILAYVVRSLFYRDTYPQFILATSSD